MIHQGGFGRCWRGFLRGEDEQPFCDEEACPAASLPNGSEAQCLNMVKDLKYCW